MPQFNSASSRRNPLSARIRTTAGADARPMAFDGMSGRCRQIEQKALSGVAQVVDRRSICSAVLGQPVPMQDAL